MAGRAVLGTAATVMAVVMTFPVGVRAQVQTLKEFHVADVEDHRSKVMALAEAFPEERYDWSPWREPAPCATCSCW